MPRINIVSRTGEIAAVEVENGASVMDALRTRGIGDLQAICGGNCACGTCHVYVDPLYLEKLTGISSQEDALLDSSFHRNERSRLSCQIIVIDELDGIGITIAPED